jgi:hypothetical protein
VCSGEITNGSAKVGGVKSGSGRSLAGVFCVLRGVGAAAPQPGHLEALGLSGGRVDMSTLSLSVGMLDIIFFRARSGPPVESIQLFSCVEDLRHVAVPIRELKMSQRKLAPGGWARVDREVLSYFTQYCFRAGDLRSGPDLGQTDAGEAPKWVLRPAFGQPEDRFQCFPGRSPAQIWPGSPISDPATLLRNME